MLADVGSDLQIDSCHIKYPCTAHAHTHARTHTEILTNHFTHTHYIHAKFNMAAAKHRATSSLASYMYVAPLQCTQCIYTYVHACGCQDHVTLEKQ